MSLNERKTAILGIIIKEYFKSAQPVSSGGLVEKYKLEVSPATVRNDMMELEEEGYIYQPHTSAGRVPTELAYDLYLNGVESKKLKDSDSRILDNIFKKEEAAFKATAKAIAELSGNAVFWAFHKNDLYYTGISNLFSQPEFKQADVVYSVSTVIDSMEEIIDNIFNDLKMGEQVLIGSKNPFGNFLSTVLIKYKIKNQTGLFGIMGPMRMDYEKNLGLVKYLGEKLGEK